MDSKDTNTTIPQAPPPQTVVGTVPDPTIEAVKPSLVKPLVSKNTKRSSIIMIIASFLVVALGVVTGWFLAGSEISSSKTAVTVGESTGDATSPEEAGIADEATFRDSAEGVLKKGGIKGEGTHYLDRDLGADKYVYLTSTIIDLDSFVDKKVTVWGETISARNAGWLMDVGKIKVVK